MTELSIIVPYRPVDEFRRKNADYNLFRLRRIFPTAEFIIADDDDYHFNRCRAINKGVNRATGNIFLFADIDFWNSENDLLYAVDVVRENKVKVSFVVPHTEIKFLSEKATNEIIEGKYFPTDVDEREVIRHFTKPPSGGVNVISRTNFEFIGRFDDRFKGWGFEDGAFKVCAETLIAPVLNLSSTAYHFYHPESFRNKKSPEYKNNCKLSGQYAEARGNKEKIKAILRERNYCSIKI